MTDNYPSPLVSILVTTYNRSHLLKRAIQSALAQDYEHLELVIIDDCSSDDTPDIVRSIDDSRIRYIRNTENVGSKDGDRIHLHRFVYTLMRGQYFVYLCDDDYWPKTTLIRRQVEILSHDQNVAMVVGGQLSIRYIKDHDLSNITSILESIPQVEYNLMHTQPKKTDFFAKGLYKKKFMTSEEFLDAFAENPHARNLIAGATLYSRKIFIQSGTFSSREGSVFQAGYELSMGPACYGQVVYLDEPAIIVTVLASNASFSRTQLYHYYDCIKSIICALHTPLSHIKDLKKRRFIKKIRRKTIRNVTRGFLVNTMTIIRDGVLDLCSLENMSCSVYPRHALKIYSIYRIFPGIREGKLIAYIYFLKLKKLITLLIRKS